MHHSSAPVSIRPATVADVPAIAEVHVHSWQWAYRGLLPDDYLDHLSIERRAGMHMQRLATETEERTWVAAQEGRIVGFAITGPSRDPDASPGTAELAAIYLRHEATGQGIAHALFDHAVHDLWQRGYEQATLWVLETNARARRFYEKAGWVPDGTTKTEEWPGVLLHEVRYRISRRAESSHDTAIRIGPERC
jgi:ribosomal protein S18 acetylase RimI-like enzyme